MPLLRLLEITDQTISLFRAEKRLSSVHGAEKRDLDVIKKPDTLNQCEDTSCFQFNNFQ